MEQYLKLILDLGWCEMVFEAITTADPMGKFSINYPSRFKRSLFVRN
jgi:hypothetical protein